MNKKITVRIVLDIFLAISVLNGWWFLAIPLGLVGVYAYPYFIEIIIAGIAYDSLFGLIPGMGMRAYAGTVITIMSIVIVSLIKKVVRK